MEAQEPRLPLTMIWRRWVGPVKKAGPNVALNVYAFMTTEPNALTASINHERMPVLLSQERDFETWLTGTPEEAFGLVRSYDPDTMRIVQSGLEKKDLLAAEGVARPWVRVFAF